MKSQTIYVYLPREVVEVWAPIDAKHIRDDVYRIVDCRGEEDETQFGEGAIVRCHLKLLREVAEPGTLHMVAFEELAE